MIRTFDHARYALGELLERKREPVTVVLPAREVADTIGEVCERILSLEGLVDQLLVVDAASRDGTAEIARAAGAEVHQEAELMPEVGPPLGKGDAMWRALAVVRGEIVVYLDSDTRDFPAHFVTGMVGPLVVEEGVEFLKATFRRPVDAAPSEQGGRVTELMARPLLSAFYPDLAALGQPLAGELAARRELFEQLPFTTGYGVEMAMLLRARERVGVAAMAQVDLELRRNYQQPLQRLGPMAFTVLQVVLEQLRREGRPVEEPARTFNAADGRAVEVELIERPPFATVRANAIAGMTRKLVD